MEDGTDIEPMVYTQQEYDYMRVCEIINSLCGMSDFDKETGLLVPPKDIDKLAEAIVYMFKDPGCRKEMAENGYRLFKEKFTINKMLKRYEQVYQKVIGS